MKKQISLLFVLLVLFVLVGCSTTYEEKARHSLKFINYNDLQFYERKPNHYIDLFFEGSSPSVEYIVLGRIDGFVTNNADINPLLKAKARQVGGDAVINIKIDYQKEEIGPTVSFGARHGGYYHDGIRPHLGVAVPYGTTETVKAYQVSATVVRYVIKRAVLPDAVQ